ncbi:6,7-dimethyl-8-ribityllumazine synthase [Geodia barretti]|uniref:6,7-dimethyl-8-ribityllumazine synthase n=1 Tax=Geodia barretti TaxID=519541 RepID=A0AA35TMU3_GEOBA|nr:6,7-dimethyl-8-ribityllumazine synthase [Geodia barretti]
MVPLLMAENGLLARRRGHTELSVYLSKIAGLRPVTAICEMLDAETYSALSVAKAERYARQNAIPFCERTGPCRVCKGTLIMNIAIVVSDFNEEITSRMLQVARERASLLGLGVVHVSHVPGAYDMPLVVDHLLRNPGIDAVATLGAIIRARQSTTRQ